MFQSTKKSNSVGISTKSHCTTIILWCTALELGTNICKLRLRQFFYSSRTIGKQVAHLKYLLYEKGRGEDLIN